MRVLISLALAFSFIAGCSLVPGSKSWCDSMDEKPVKDWSADDAATYAKHCVINDVERMGAKKWCAMMDKKDSADWTTADASDYTKYCVFKADVDEKEEKSDSDTTSSKD